MRVRSALAALVVFVVSFGFASVAHGQVGITAAQLSGVVQDKSGGAVAKATISLTEVDTNRTYKATSDTSGYYVLPNLQPGTYEIKVTYPGFATYIQKMALTVGQTATVNVTLQIQAVGQQVVVTGAVQAIEPTRTEISHVINDQAISSLPISGRLFTDFVLLTPGVATGRTSLQSTITEFETTRISFGGMRDLDNLVTVDGADTINTADGSQRSTPPQASVSEFRVVNSDYGAEYGRALGGIVNVVTKTGTNNFHGSVYEFLQNNATDARSLIQPAPQPNVLRQNQFGATFGGPIQKNKTFFFMNYEGQRRAESPTFPETLIGDLSLINAAKVAMGIAPENLNVLKTEDNDKGFASLDHQFNADNRLGIRYNIEDARDHNELVGSTLDGGGIGAPSSGHNLFLRDQSLIGTVTSQFSPTVINSFLMQYARRHYNFPGVTGQPNLDIPNSLLFGHNFGVLDAIDESRVQGSDTVDWVKGSHVAKFGTDINYINNFVIWPGFTPMRIVLPGVNCLVEFANFVNPNANIPLSPNPGDTCPLPPVLNGTPIVFWGAPVGSGPLTPGFEPPQIPTNWQNAYLPSQTVNFSETLDHGYYGFFAQDQWRVTPKLTFNYGVRYDFESGLWKQVNEYHNGIQPRVGLAYSPNPKTVIRAGFGIFDSRYNLSFLFITQPQRPVVIPGVNLPGIRVGANTATWVLNQLVPGPAIEAPGFGFPADAAKTLILTGQVPPQYITGGCPPAPGQDLSCTAGAGMVDHNSQIPYSEQANLEIDRELANGLTVSAGYQFVGAHHLVRAENLNVCPPGGLTNSATSCPPATTNPVLVNEAPAPDWPKTKEVFSGPLYYNSGLLYYTDNSGNSVYHGLTLQVNERYKSILQLGANYTFSKTLDDGTFTTFVSTPQDFYERNLERANSNQDVRNRFVAHFVANAPDNSFLRNFQLSSIITMQSGRPFTEFVGFDANGDTNPVTDRVGTAARNTYWGDSLQTIDLRLSRFFKIRENGKLDLAIDAFNMFNRPNVDEVTSVYGTYLFCGGVPSHYKDAASLAIERVQVGGCPAGGPPVPNPLFGGPRTMFNPRQLQFSATFSF
ncbi:MAG: TonB-dependent receptor [Acidobacteriota bacterium]|nr:TonB-dependent receptor [Acidobacteriota bacterium]